MSWRLLLFTFTVLLVKTLFQEILNLVFCCTIKINLREKARIILFDHCADVTYHVHMNVIFTVITITNTPTALAAEVMTLASRTHCREPRAATVAGLKVPCSDQLGQSDEQIIVAVMATFLGLHEGDG